MYLTFGDSYALHGLVLGDARAWFSGESAAAAVADPDYTLILYIDRAHALELEIDRGHSLSLNIDRAVELTLEK